MTRSLQPTWCAQVRYPFWSIAPAEPTSTGMLAWHQPKPGHQLAWVFKTGYITDFGNQGNRDGGIYAAKRAQRINERRKMPLWDGFINRQIERVDTILNLANRAAILQKQFADGDRESAAIRGSSANGSLSNKIADNEARGARENSRAVASQFLLLACGHRPNRAHSLLSV